VATWRSAWERFIPFLAYPAVIRKIVYTTDERIKRFAA
jgi:putative transposase